jgi:glutaredoxin
VVKKFLDERSVEYELRNVVRDEDAARDFLALGARLPPLLVIGDTLVYGFRPAEIERALGLG